MLEASLLFLSTLAWNFLASTLELSEGISRWGMYFSAIAVTTILILPSIQRLIKAVSLTRIDYLFRLVSIGFLLYFFAQFEGASQVLAPAALFAITMFLGLILSKRLSNQKWPELLSVAFTALSLSLLLLLMRSHSGIISKFIEPSLISILVFLYFIIGFRLGLSSNQGTTRFSGSELFALNLLKFALLPLAFIFSFRGDALLNSTALHHWEFFTNMIRSYRIGGEAFWDTPSQYGFLNLKLASLIPKASEWDQLHLFQASLLFVTSTIGVLTINRVATSKYQGLFFSVLFLALLHFADPQLLGPQPYPGSSVVRFFPIYLLIAIICNSKNPSLRGLAAVPAFSFFWSAEVFIYTIAVFYGFFLSELNTLSTCRLIAKRISQFAALSIALILAGTVLLIASRTQPLDMTMHFLAAHLYAGGYGSFPVSVVNPALILIVLIGNLVQMTPWLSSSENMQDRRIILSSVFGIFGILSYYFGRAAPDNIIALSPLIFFFGTVAFLKIYGASNERKSANLQVALMTLILLPLGVFFTPAWKDFEFSRLKPQFSIREVLPSYDAEIILSLQGAGIAPGDGLLHYSHEPAPYRIDEIDLHPPNCFPGPAQLLEEPMPHNIRIQFLDRFFERRIGPKHCWIIVTRDI